MKYRVGDTLVIKDGHGNPVEVTVTKICFGGYYDLEAVGIPFPLTLSEKVLEKIQFQEQEITPLKQVI